MARFIPRSLTTSIMLLALGSSVVLAGDAQITARQDEMKANGKALGALVAIMKGDVPYSADLVKEKTSAMVEAAKTAEAAHAWDADQQTGGTVETWAKPEIWTNKADFDAKAKALQDALVKVAATSDEAGFKAAFPNLGAACKSCHEAYRRPKD